MSHMLISCVFLFGGFMLRCVSGIVFVQWAWMSVKLSSVAVTMLECCPEETRVSPAVTTVSLQMSGFLSLLKSLFLSSLVALSHSTSLSQSLSVLCYFCFLQHTHTHSDTHTLLKLSCGNRPCPCKSWLRVINQASQPSSTFVWFDWTATVCHRKRPKALRVYMSYIYKYACITILLFDRKPKQQQCCLTFQCFSPFCKWDVFDFC